MSLIVTQKQIKKDTESTLLIMVIDRLQFPRILPGLSLKFLVHSLRSPHKTQSIVWRSVCRSACSLILRSTWNTRDKETSHQYLSSLIHYMWNDRNLDFFALYPEHDLMYVENMLRHKDNTETLGECFQSWVNICKDSTYNMLTCEDMKGSADTVCYWITVWSIQYKQLH